MMSVSKWGFEAEIDVLLNAAADASSEEKAKRYLKQARRKIDLNDNISDVRKQKYYAKVSETESRLNGASPVPQTA